MYKIGVYRIAGVWCCCYFADLRSYFQSFCVMSTDLFWCAYTARGISTNHMLLICCRTVSVFGQDVRCKQRGQTATIWWKTCCLIWLVMCSPDLHWHWIKWTLLFDTMEVSMLHLEWLVIAQHVFQPALTGRLESISRKIVSCNRESWWAHFSENCLLRIGGQGVTAFSQKNISLLGAKKWGPTCDRDISSSAIYRDISGVHCIKYFAVESINQSINQIQFC